MSGTKVCPSPWVWSLAAFIAALGGLWMWAAGVRVLFDEILSFGAMVIALLAIAGLCIRKGRGHAIAAMAAGMALIFVLNPALAALSYAAVWLAWPLQDAAFASADAALRFDWVGHLRFVAERPWLSDALWLAYQSSVWQLFAVVLALSFYDRAALRTFFALYVTTALVTITISVFVPAAGAYVFHAPPEELVSLISDPAAGRWHLSHFTALREGRFEVFSLAQIEGIVTFPSFHTVVAVLFAWAFLRVPYLALPGLALNGVMLVSTIAIGGHYVVDIIAGLVIALVALAVAQGRAAAAEGGRAGAQAARGSPAAPVRLDRPLWRG